MASILANFAGGREAARGEEDAGVAKRILIIDDDSDVRITLTVILEERGYEVIAAENGQQGLVAFREERPDLLVTDIVMPVKEGLQTITEIRRERPDMKIIAISGGSRGARHDFLDIARQLGAWDVIVKPFDVDDFAARIESCLSG
jgi:DNA-binding response OmpR family regulator